VKARRAKQFNLLKLQAPCREVVSVYEIITGRIVELLEKGTVPWHKPWKGSTKAPKNLVSGKEYRGMNVLVLASAGFESPWWLTYRQAIERGGHVKKGAEGFPVLYWNWVARHGDLDSEAGAAVEETRAAKRKMPLVRYYTVFNVLQCDGVEYAQIEVQKTSFSPLEVCEAVVAGMHNPPTIDKTQSKAFYCPSEDLVAMPKPEKFDRAEEFYSTLFHELTHSTGHAMRLNRDGIMDRPIFGSADYTKEELVAEMGAAFLCGYCGIESKVLGNSASYIDNWLRKLKNDAPLVVHAAAQAQKAADYILNRVFDSEEQEPEIQREENE